MHNVNRHLLVAILAGEGLFGWGRGRPFCHIVICSLALFSLFGKSTGEGDVEYWWVGSPILFFQTMPTSIPLLRGWGEGLLFGGEGAV